MNSEKVHTLGMNFFIDTVIECPYAVTSRKLLKILIRKEDGYYENITAVISL
jgi:hypothetical protein